MARLSLILGLTLAMPACSRGTTEMDAAEALLAPCASDFAAYDRWVRRTAAVYLETGRADALEETLFAPIRRHERIITVWIDLDGRTMALRPSIERPENDGWLSIEDSELGRVRVNSMVLEDPRPGTEGELEVTLIERSGYHLEAVPDEAPTSDIALTVTAAISPPG